MVLMMIAAPNKSSNYKIKTSYSGTLTEDDAALMPPSLEFFKVSSDKVSLKHQGEKSYHWIKIIIPKLKEIDDPIFVLNPHITSEFKLFLNNDLTKPISHQTRYDFLPDAPYTNQNKVVNLEPYADASHFYLLVTEVRNITINLSVWDESNYLNYDLHINSFFSAVIFGLFLMLVINSFFYISNRNRSYLFYILYHSCVLILILNMTGFIFHYPALSWFGESFSHQIYFLALSCIFLAYFVRSFLNTKHYTPKLDTTIKVVQSITGFLLLTVIIFPDLSGTVVDLLNLIALIGIPLYTTVMLLHLKLGNRQAIFFTLAFSLLLFASAFRILYIWDQLPQTFFTEYGAIVAIFIEAIIFSIGLADSLVQMQIQRDHAKTESQETAFVYNLEKDFNRLISMINNHVHQSEESDHRQFIVDSFFKEFKDTLGVTSNAVVYKNANGIQKVLDTRHQNGYHYQIIEANLNRIESIAKKGHPKKLTGKNSEFLIFPVPLRQHEWSAAVLELSKETKNTVQIKSFIQKYSRELIRSILNADSISAIKSKADFDELTGTYNRGAIEAFIAHALEESYDSNNPLSIAFIDFDDFKLINDVYGHQAGDLCLKQFVETFKEVLPSNYQIGRFGGDEFIIVMPKTNPFRALRLLNQAKNKIAPIDYRDQIIIFTISIGIASQSSQNVKLNELLEFADKSLYESKGNGKNLISVA